jgi:hypothetical protein
MHQRPVSHGDLPPAASRARTAAVPLPLLARADEVIE